MEKVGMDHKLFAVTSFIFFYIMFLLLYFLFMPILEFNTTSWSNALRQEIFWMILSSVLVFIIIFLPTYLTMKNIVEVNKKSVLFLSMLVILSIALPLYRLNSDFEKWRPMNNATMSINQTLSNLRYIKRKVEWSNINGYRIDFTYTANNFSDIKNIVDSINGDGYYVKEFFVTLGNRVYVNSSFDSNDKQVVVVNDISKVPYNAPVNKLDHVQIYFKKDGIISDINFMLSYKENGLIEVSMVRM